VEFVARRKPDISVLPDLIKTIEEVKSINFVLVYRGTRREHRESGKIFTILFRHLSALRDLGGKQILYLYSSLEILNPKHQIKPLQGLRGRGAEPHMFRISDLVFGILQLNNYKNTNRLFLHRSYHRTL